VLVVANHPNALVDPMVLFSIAGRSTRPLAKAPLFDQALVGTVLRGLGGLPVYRRQDDASLMGGNDRTFAAAVEALRAGGAVQIYPEGQSHSGPALTPLKTGAARIALLAEEQAGWDLGLVIIPVGLTYERKHLFRGCVVATVGERLLVGGWRERHRADPQAAVRALTAELAERLGAVTLNLEDAADRPLLDVAERLYVREKGLAGWRERESLGRRLPRLQAFARGLAWLRAHDPDAYGHLRRRVESYGRLQELLGVNDADVPRRYGVGPVTRFAVREGMWLMALLPLAAVATVAWAVPYWIPRWVVASVRPEHDAISTYKLGAAILAFPLAWMAWGLAAYVAAGAGWGVGVMAALPAAGLRWVAWTERWRRVSEDVRVFLRAAPRSRLRERLGGLRSRLAEEFEAVAAILPDGEEPPGA
jgi:1-acyl-sn-glycerol-3-phosphate acyltransferase